MECHEEERRRLQTISKFLSQAEGGECVGLLLVPLHQVLRHAAKDFNLEVRSDGACRVRDIVKLLWYERWVYCTVADLRTIVDKDQKGRFVLDVDDGTIRATQGWSEKMGVTDEHLRPIPLDIAEELCCMHGTFRCHLESISRWGLLAGGFATDNPRIHVHCTPHYPWKQRFQGSGIRDGTQVPLQVNMAPAIRAGLSFFLSENEVILCRGDSDGGIPPEFIDDVYWDFRDRCNKYLPGRSWRHPGEILEHNCVHCPEDYCGALPWIDVRDFRTEPGSNAADWQ